MGYSQMVTAGQSGAFWGEYHSRCSWPVHPWGRRMDFWPVRGPFLGELPPWVAHDVPEFAPVCGPCRVCCKVYGDACLRDFFPGDMQPQCMPKLWGGVLCMCLEGLCQVVAFPNGVGFRDKTPLGSSVPFPLRMTVRHLSALAGRTCSAAHCPFGGPVAYFELNHILVLSCMFLSVSDCGNTLHHDQFTECLWCLLFGRAPHGYKAVDSDAVPMPRMYPRGRLVSTGQQQMPGFSPLASSRCCATPSQLDWPTDPYLCALGAVWMIAMRRDLTTPPPLAFHCATLQDAQRLPLPLPLLRARCSSTTYALEQC